MSTDFALAYLIEVAAICKRHRVSAHDKFAIHCEIAAPAYICEATDADFGQLHGESESRKQGDLCTVARSIARHSLTHLEGQGVTASNVKEYMDRRIREFEETARRRKSAT